MEDKRKKIVVIGGGHGQSTILRGIKNIDDLDITAIVTVADDGGSTGRLVRKFHIPAMGDIRNVMVALSESETLFSELMDFRFEDPMNTEEDVLGHSLGNLILTAMTEQCGSFMKAVSLTSEVLNVKGDIIPATTQIIQLYAKMDDGVIVRGEANIPNVDNHISKVFYQEEVIATPEAVQAILEADVVVYGIGSVYTSILPNVIIPGIKQALHDTNATRVYICNAMSQPGETDGYSVEDHVKALVDHGAMVDAVVVATEEIPAYVLERYAKMGSTPVFLEQDEHAYEVIEKPLLMFHDGKVRHNYHKIEKAFEDLMHRKRS